LAGPKQAPDTLDGAPTPIRLGFSIMFPVPGPGIRGRFWASTGRKIPVPNCPGFWPGQFGTGFWAVRTSFTRKPTQNRPRKPGPGTGSTKVPHDSEHVNGFASNRRPRTSPDDPYDTDKLQDTSSRQSGQSIKKPPRRTWKTVDLGDPHGPLPPQNSWEKVGCEAPHLSL
jgi:hypothetical protein